jgi:hypothetical protein
MLIDLLLIVVITLVGAVNLFREKRYGAIVTVLLLGFISARLMRKLEPISSPLITNQPRRDLNGELRLVPPQINSPGSGSTVDNSSPTIAGEAEPGDTVIIYLEAEEKIELGKTTADALGRWSYTLEPEQALQDGTYEITAVAVKPSGDRSEFSELLTFKVAASLPSQAAISPNPDTLTQTVYKATDVRNMDDVVVYDLDKVCLPPKTESTKAKSVTVDYEGVFQGDRVPGEMSFDHCTTGGNVNASGDFRDRDNCEGELSLLITDRDSLGKVEEAVLYWQYKNCSRGTDTSVASVSMVSESTTNSAE